MKRTDLENGGCIDTCSVTDSTVSYETAAKHPDYNNGAWIIVAEYATANEAADGHDYWVDRMLTEPLPAELTDVSTAPPAAAADDAKFGDRSWRTHKRETKGGE